LNRKVKKVKIYFMVMTENEINKLNVFLETGNFDINAFDSFFQSMMLDYGFKFRFFDFEHYNEKKLEEAIKEQTRSVNLLHFERAASYRYLELECKKHIGLRASFKIEKSAFCYEQDYLVYFHFGTAKNDLLVRRYLQEKYDTFRL